MPTLEPETAVQDASMAQAIHQVVQFSRVVRYRKNIVVLALVASALLGGLYYATATRYYEAKASLLILQTGTEMLNTSMKPEGMTQSLMPTYERLLTSAVVLETALNYVGPQDRIDFQEEPPDRWLELLRRNLSVSTVRRTNLLELSYRSRSPQSAVVMVNAVVRAYLEFMEKTHKGTAGEIIAVLTREKANLETRLAGKEAEVLQIRRRFGDMGIRTGDKVLHPVVQRAVQLNEALIEAHKKRLEVQSTLACSESLPGARRGPATAHAGHPGRRGPEDPAQRPGLQRARRHVASHDRAGPDRSAGGAAQRAGVLRARPPAGYGAAGEDPHHGDST